MEEKEYEKAVITLSKDALSQLRPADYSGRIVVIDKPDGIEEAVADLRKSEIIGFDTETRPSFKKGLLYNVSLIQLATKDSCYLFRTNLIGYPRPLIELLEDPQILKIGLSIHDDFHNLKRVTELEPAGFIDLQSFVKDYKIIDNSLSKVYGILFDERISKGQRLTNWECAELTKAQQTYAALDAYACIRIYEFLKSNKFDPKKSRYLCLPPETEEIKI